MNSSPQSELLGPAGCSWYLAAEVTAPPFFRVSRLVSGAVAPHQLRRRGHRCRHYHQLCPSQDPSSSLISSWCYQKVISYELLSPNWVFEFTSRRANSPALISLDNSQGDSRSDQLHGALVALKGG